MATDFDPYRILEVPVSARQEQIDEAYRRQWAVSGNDPARMRELQTAYQLLSDPAERQSYDERRANAPAATAVATRDIPLETPATSGTADEPRWTLGDIIRSVLAIVAIVILGSVPIYVVAAAIAGSADEIEKDATALTIVLLASLLFQLAALGAVWYFAIRKYKLSWASLGLRKPQVGWPWLPFTLVMGAMAIVIVYGIILSALGVSPDTDLPDAVYDNPAPLIIALILTTFVAPVVEEIYFRGFVFGGLAKRYGWVIGALGSGCLFGAAHLANAGYFYVVPPIVGIGVLFAWAYYHTKSIYTSMAAHFMFNLIQMIAVLATR